MAKQEQQQNLGKTLWSIADDLRGSMDADDFRDYMLVFLFLYYLSNTYQITAKKLLHKAYPETQAGTTPLQQWYDENKVDIKDFEEVMYRKLHHVINPKYLWENIASLAQMQSKELLKTLQEGFKHIEEESFEKTFKGLFSEINLSSEKLGKNQTERNALLCRIVNAIKKGLEKTSTGSDRLGDAYEYLIGQFAAGSGKKAG